MSSGFKSPLWVFGISGSAGPSVVIKKGFLLIQKELARLHIEKRTETVLVKKDRQ